MKKTLYAFVILLLLLAANPSAGIASSGTATPAPTEAAAPETTAPKKEDVEIPMRDGLKVQGNFYYTSGKSPAPAILLLHQNNGSRKDWDLIIPVLTKAGYSILAVDQRGFGKTEGDRGWSLGPSDAKTLMAWLRAQKTVDPERVAVMGGSVGANVALRVCADDDKCHVVIALSPGLAFFGISTKSAVEAMQNKSILLVAGQKDGESTQAVRALQTWVPDENNVMTRLYADSRLHAALLLNYPDLIPLIMGWLEAHNVAAP